MLGLKCAEDIVRKFNDMCEHFKIYKNKTKMIDQFRRIYNLHATVKELSISIIYKILIICNHVQKKYNVNALIILLAFYFRMIVDFNSITEIVISVVYIWSMLAITDTLLMCHVNFFNAQINYRIF